MKKRILIVMMNLYNGGAEKSLVNLMNELDYSQYDVDLLLFQKKGLFLKQISHNVKIIEQPDDLYYLYNKPALKDLFDIKKIKFIICRCFYTLLVNIKYKKYNHRVRKQIRWDNYYDKLVKQYNVKYDIALSYLENEPMRYLINKTVSFKKYVWFHNDYKKLGLDKRYDVRYYNMADKIITVSGACLKVFSDVFPEFKSKTIYIPNISSRKTIISLSNESPRFKYDSDIFKILSIGRLSYEKGFDIAIESARILKERKIKYQWFIIGDGLMKNEILKKIKVYDLEECFCLIGVTDNPYSYMRKSDILVQTSRSEGKSMVLDEAKIMGKPFVVTKYPTVYDQANEDIAILVDISPESVAEGIMELYNDRGKIDLLSKKLKSVDYSNTKDIEKYYKLFDE